MLVPWTALRPSQQAWHWRLTGTAIAATSSLALLAAAAVSTPFNPVLAILSAITAVVAWAGAREHGAGSFEIGVSFTGEIVLRESASVEPTNRPPLQVSFAAPWLISLRRGTMLIPIWPDSLPPDVYRRLWVHLRWGKAVPNNNDQQSKQAAPMSSESPRV